MADNFRQVIEVALQATQDPNLRAILEQLRDLGDQGALTDDQLSQVTDALQQFNATAAQSAGLQSSIDQLGKYRAEQEKVGAAVDKATLKLELASEQESASAAALAESETALAQVRAEREKYLASEERTAQGTREFAQALTEAKNATKAAQAEYAESSATLRQANTEYERAADAQDKLTAGIDKNETAIKAAGLSVEDLGEAQAELQKRMAATASSTDALAQNIRGSVAANQQAAAAAKQNAAATKALADANATLGRRSFEEVRAEIDKVRQAYETLRRSGTLSAQELAQAQSRVIERTRELRAEYGSLGNSLRQVQGSLIAAGAGLFTATRALTAATQKSIEFGTAMAEVSTLLDDTSGLAELSESVQQLAREFGKPKAQAEALYQVISAGATDAAEANRILEQSNKLAIAGVSDLKIAADGVTSVLNAYGQSAADAERVSDTLFAAVRAGKTTVDELAGSIGQVAPIAATAGVNFEELAATIATLTQGGVATSQAVTQIRGVLASVIKPTADAAKAAEELGIEFDLAALRSKGLAGFLGDIAAKAGGNEQALARLFGSVEGLQAVFALVGAQADNFARNLDSVASAAGATQTAFDKLNDEPAQRMVRFNAAIELLQISFGNAVASLSPLLEGLTSLINAFNQLPAGVRTTTAGVVALAAVIAPLAIAINQSKAALVLLVGSLSTVGPAAAGAGAGVGVYTTAANAATAATARLNLSLGRLGKSFAAVGVAVAGFEVGQALGRKLNDLEVAATETGRSVSRLAQEIDQAGEAGARQADQFSNFADVQVKSAEAATQLGDAQREAYRTALEGLEQYLQGRGRELIAIKQRGEATAEELAELDQTKQRLAEVRQSFVDLDRAGLGAAESIAAVSEAADPAPFTKLADEIRRAAREGQGLSEAIRGAFDGVDFENEAGKLGRIALAFAEAGKEGGEAGKAIREGIAKEIASLSGRELLRFQQAAQFAFDQVGKSGDAAAATLNTTFEQAVRRLGVSFEAAGIKISEEGGNIIATFQTLAQSGLANADAIQQGFRSALAKVSTSAEVQALGDALTSAANRGVISAQQYDLALQQIKERLKEVQEAAKGTTSPPPPPPSVAQGYKGIASAANEAADAAGSIGEQAAEGAQQAAKDVPLIVALLQQAQQEFATFSSNSALALEKFNTQLSRSDFVAFRTQDAMRSLERVSNDLREELAANQAVARNTAAGLEQIANAATLAEFAVADFGAGLAVGLEGTAEEIAGLLKAIDDVKRGAETAREDLQLLDDATLDQLEQSARRAAERVKGIGDAALQASQQLQQLERQLQDEADRAAGNEENIRRRQLADQLREIDRLAAATNGADADRAARLRRLAQEAFDRDIQLIRAREREQNASDDRVRQRRDQSNQGGSATSGTSGSISRGDDSRASPSRQPITPSQPPIVINFTGPTLGTPQDLARELTQQIDRLQRRGYNPRTGR